MEGDWTREKRDCYGFSRLTDEHKDQAFRQVRFNTPITVSGTYTLYIYVPKVQHPSSTTAIAVSDGGKITAASIPTGKLQVEGQTSGEWVKCGQYQLEKGKDNYVEISNKGADGAVIADAVLLIKTPGR